VIVLRCSRAVHQCRGATRRKAGMAKLQMVRRTEKNLLVTVRSTVAFYHPASSIDGLLLATLIIDLAVDRSSDPESTSNVVG
jgi:hypothetical protein